MFHNVYWTSSGKHRRGIAASTHIYKTGRCAASSCPRALLCLVVALRIDLEAATLISAAFIPQVDNLSHKFSYDVELVALLGICLPQNIR